MPRGHKGEPRTPGAGRKKGSPNKITRSVKDMVSIVFNNLQGKPGVNLEDWATENTTEFYKIAAKLIPTDVTATVQHKGLADVLGTLGRSERTNPPLEETRPDTIRH